MSRPPLLSCLLGLATTLAAQTPAPPVRVMRGQELVDAESGKPLGPLGINGAAFATPIADDLFAIGDATVDAREPAVLEVVRGALKLRQPGGDVVWRHDLTAIHAATDSQPAQRLLTSARVILPASGGGLLALARETGDPVWEQRDCPSGLVLVDRDLVVAAGAVDKAQEVQAMALANGAVAFRTGLPGPPRLLAASRLGIAVAGSDYLAIHDRSGPLLFTERASWQGLAAGPDGWFTADDTGLRAIDRTGKELWRRALSPVRGGFDCRQLTVTGSGDALLLQYVGMADSGMRLQLFAGTDGSPVWDREVPGLGVPHSKYHHHAYVVSRRGRIYAVSQGSAGAFDVVLDAATGELVERHQPPMNWR